MRGLGKREREPVAHKHKAAKRRDGGNKRPASAAKHVDAHVPSPLLASSPASPMVPFKRPRGRPRKDGSSPGTPRTPTPAPCTPTPAPGPPRPVGDGKGALVEQVKGGSETLIKEVKEVKEKSHKCKAAEGVRGTAAVGGRGKGVEGGGRDKEGEGARGKGGKGARVKEVGKDKDKEKDKGKELARRAAASVCYV